MKIGAWMAAAISPMRMKIDTEVVAKLADVKDPEAVTMRGLAPRGPFFSWHPS